jgi:hypothetical protein
MAASANDAVTIPARVITVSNSPVAVTRCSYISNFDGIGQDQVTINLTNRSMYPLLSANVRLQYYDGEGAVGQAMTLVRPPQNEDVLASGDSTSYSDTNVMHNDYGPNSQLRAVTCRIESATFTRARKWTYGQTYSGKLLPLSFDRSAAPAVADVNPPASTARATSQSVAIAMGQAWVSHVPNVGSFVHVRVTLTAPNTIDVSPSDFLMNMTLVNGATKTYSPLAQPAPRVLRAGLLSYDGDPSELTPSIVPSEDFGTIGTMTLQPNVAVTTVLTYPVDLLGGSGTVNKIVFAR